MQRISSRVWDALASLKVTIVCLALLMVLVAACTRDAGRPADTARMSAAPPPPPPAEIPLSRRTQTT